MDRYLKEVLSEYIGINVQYLYDRIRGDINVKLVESFKLALTSLLISRPSNTDQLR